MQVGDFTFRCGSLMNHLNLVKLVKLQEFSISSCRLWMGIPQTSILATQFVNTSREVFTSREVLNLIPSLWKLPHHQLLPAVLDSLSSPKFAILFLYWLETKGIFVSTAGQGDKVIGPQILRLLGWGSGGATRKYYFSWIKQSATHCIDLRFALSLSVDDLET